MMKALLLKEWKQRKWLVVAIIMVVISAAWFFLSGDKNKEKPASPPVPVTVTPVMRQDVPLTIREVGTVTANETVAVRSRIDSQIMEVKFNDGDIVHKGDVLFVLDDRTLKAELAQMEANLRRDNAQLQNLQRQYERIRDLAAKGYVSKAEGDDAKAAYEAQRATLGASRASLDNIRVQLGYTQITAPITGRTGTINVTVGNNVKANDVALVTINQTQPILVQMTLSQSYVDAVRRAMAQGKVTVVAMREDGGIVSEGTLEYIDNMVNQASGTFVARAVFPNNDESLWPGMFVTAVIKLGEEKQVLVVPEVAVQHGQEGDFVFVIENNKAVRRPVKPSRIHNKLAVIPEGLTEGQSIAVDGLMSLKDGSAVSIKNNAGKAQEAAKP